MSFAAFLLASTVLSIGGSRTPAVVEGSGRRASVTRSAAGAHAVETRGPVDIVVTLGSTEQVVLTGDDNLLPMITTRVDGGVLVVGMDGHFRTRQPMRADVTLASLDAVSVRGSGDIEATAKGAASFEVTIQGSGNVTVGDLSATRVEADVRGSGDVQLRGTCGRLSVDIAGSGDVEAEGLACDEADVEVRGSGDTAVTAAKRLDVSIHGSGDVSYAGAAPSRSDVRGSGSVRRR